MTKKDIQKIKKFTKKVTSSEKKSRHFLISAGICNESGSLKEPYK